MAAMDTRKLLETLTRNPAAASALGGLAGSLLGNVLGGGGKRGSGGLLKTGGLAAVGYMAWQAWQRHQAAQQGAAPPATAQPGTFDPQQMPAALPDAFDLGGALQAGLALKTVQAMIAVSRADGGIDAAERTRIFSRVDAAGLSAQEQEEALRQLTQPVGMDELVRGVEKPEHAAEIYTAALLAAHPVNRAERAWLDMLAARLGIEPALALEIDHGVAQATS
jgi:uncharacterized membrane protein YebE (DUF533 family)